jgi:hypothetical protein
MYYLMDMNHSDLFEELLAQFRAKHPTVVNSLTDRFSALVNSMVSAIMKKYDVNT